MKDKKSPYSPDLEDLNQILHAIRSEGHLAGVLLSYCDGTLINGDLSKKAQKEMSLMNFVPMIASVLKSGEKLSQIVGERELIKIIAQLNNHSIIIFKYADSNLFLTLLVDHFSPVGSIIDTIETNIDDYLLKISKFI